MYYSRIEYIHNFSMCQGLLFRNPVSRLSGCGRLAAAGGRGAAARRRVPYARGSI